MKREFISKEDRLKVYQLAVEFIDNRHLYCKTYGLCNVIYHSARKLDIDLLKATHITQFPELFKFAPKHSQRGGYWWPMPDWKIRRRVLLSAIEDLKSKM